MPELDTKLKWDFTVNVPTVLAILAAVASTIGWGFDLYRGLDSRLQDDRKEISVLRRDLDRVEVAAAEIRRDQLSQLQALRAEMRGEMRDMSAKLDKLLMRGDRL